MVRIAVCGGQHFGKTVPEKRFIYKTLHEIAGTETVCVIQGGASGSDKIAKQWARRNKHKWLTFKAEWKNLEAPNAVVDIGADGKPYNKMAGFERNQRMLDEGRPDLLVAFPGNKGTRDTIRRARILGIEFLEVSFDLERFEQAAESRIGDSGLEC